MSDRKKAIETLKQLRLDYEEFYEEHNNEVTQAYDMAIASLKTDEAYQLEYESTTKDNLGFSSGLKNGSPIIDWNNCHTSEQLDSIATTKNNLVVDAVSRQAINGYIDYILSHGMGKKKSFDFIKKFVAKLPSVTPQEPRKGKWTKISNTVPCMNCPICGSTFTLIQGGNKMHYCPNCGADMREAEE